MGSSLETYDCRGSWLLLVRYQAHPERSNLSQLHWRTRYIKTICFTKDIKWITARGLWALLHYNVRCWTSHWWQVLEIFFPFGQNSQRQKKRFSEAEKIVCVVAVVFAVTVVVAVVVVVFVVAVVAEKRGRSRGKLKIELITERKLGLFTYVATSTTISFNTFVNMQLFEGARAPLIIQIET